MNISIVLYVNLIKDSINNDYGTLWIGDYDLRILIEAINRCGYQVRQINYYHSEPSKSSMGFLFWFIN